MHDRVRNAFLDMAAYADAKGAGLVGIRMLMMELSQLGAHDALVRVIHTKPHRRLEDMTAADWAAFAERARAEASVAPRQAKRKLAA